MFFPFFNVGTAYRGDESNHSPNEVPPEYRRSASSLGAGVRDCGRNRSGAPSVAANLWLSVLSALVRLSAGRNKKAALDGMSLYFAARQSTAMLQMGKLADGEARERLIIWLRRRMEEFGITFDALAASIQHDIDHAPVYRDARGNEWNGLGDLPEWLRAARNAGVDPDFFRIERPRGESSAQADSPSQNGKAKFEQLDLFG